MIKGYLLGMGIRGILSCIAVMGLLLGGVGCSRVSIMYRFAGPFVVTAIDKYFDLDSTQAEKTRTLVDKELKGLVQHQIPHVNESLREYLRLVKNPDLTRAQYDAFADRARDKFLAALPQLEGSVKEFTASLTPRQMEHYGKIALENLRKEEERLKSSAGREKQLRQRISFGYDLVGLELNAAQKEQFARFLAESKYPFELEIRNRERTIRKFLEAAKKPDTRDAFLHEILHHPLRFRDDAYRKAYEEYRQISHSFQHRLIRSFTEAQQIRIERKVRDLIQQLEELRRAEGFACPSPCGSPMTSSLARIASRR
ncbi:MAG: DUF6279 family lipoprotein [Bacteriovoracia bacterium]